jgi:hypothetical protein
MSLNLPIWRDSARLGVLIEEAVRGWPRYHTPSWAATRTVNLRRRLPFLPPCFDRRHS